LKEAYDALDNKRKSFYDEAGGEYHLNAGVLAKVFTELLALNGRMGKKQK
jgi:hypothetical protein